MRSGFMLVLLGARCPWTIGAGAADLRKSRGPPRRPGATEVDGGTEVRLTHEGFPAAESKTGHEEGWTACVERLANKLG